jgi:uncharacterized DUF497 family protein
MKTEFFPGFNGFEWDSGNIDKNRIKHKVECHECEQVFYNEPIIILPDFPHSQKKNVLPLSGNQRMAVFL